MLPGFVYRPTGRVDEDLTYHDDRVSDTYGRGQDLPAPAIAIIVQDDDVVEALGLLNRGDVVTTFQRRVLITEIGWVRDATLTVEHLLGRVPTRVRGHASAVLRSGGPIPPATWLALRAALEQHAEAGELLRRLDKRASPPRWVTDTSTRSRSVVEQEQDAVGLALEFGDN